MSGSLTLEQKAANFIAQFEAPGGKPVLTSYQDIAGVWTIGFGTTSGVGPGMTWTEEQCRDALAGDVGNALSWIVARNKWHPWTTNQIVALASLAYNIGLSAFAGSYVWVNHNRGDRLGAGNAFLDWDMAHVGGSLVVVAGLLKRRKAERALYLS